MRTSSQLTVFVSFLGISLLAACGQSNAPSVDPSVRGATPATNLTWATYDRPEENAIVSEKDVPITVSDGTILRANVDRPDKDGKFPVIVELTPYNKNAPVAQGYTYLQARGYVQVTVDVRGTGSSQGTWDSTGPQEQRDGYDVIEWAARQPWSDGNVGMMGPSYMGFTQIQTAALKPPHLKAIFPIVPMSDAYRDIVYPGGQTNIAFIPLWLGLVTGTGVVPPLYAVNDPSPQNFVLALTTLLQHISGIGSFQASTVANAMAGGDTVYDGPYWKTRSPLELDDSIDIPVFVAGGTHDLFQRGEPMHYERFKGHTTTKLLIGPWTHVDGSSGKPLSGQGIGLPRDGVPDYDHIALQWFDQWLKGMDTGADKMPPVTYWNYGDERFETQADWPLPNIAPQRWYLRGTSAESGLTGGTLETSPATGDEGTDTYVQHPVSGICTQSTGQWTAGAGDALPCDTNDRYNEAAEVKFTTAPMEKEMRFQGPILANLWLQTTAADAVVSVRVTDVAPDGSSKELTAGWMAASFRALDPAKSRYVRGELLQPWHPYTRESVLPVTGEPMELQVEIFPTNATILPGHSLRVAVGPSDFPHALPPLPQLQNTLGGVVTLLRDSAHPSYVTLPTLGSDCVKAGCAALDVPDMVRH